MSSLSDKFIFANFSIEIVIFLFISVLFGMIGYFIKKCNKDSEDIKNDDHPFTPAVGVDILAPTVQVAQEI